MTLRLLIDGCLSPELVLRAVQAGYPEPSCVRDRGLSGTRDWKLTEPVVAGDWTLLTHNAIDFRGGGQVASPASTPGSLSMRVVCLGPWICDLPEPA